MKDVEEQNSFRTLKSHRFRNLTKVSNGVPLSRLWKAIEDQVINKKYMRVVQALYTKMIAHIKIGKSLAIDIRVTKVLK